MTIPLAQQIRCAERELAMRQRVYPNWVAGGRLSQEKADHEIAAMRAIVETLRASQEKQAELF